MLETLFASGRIADVVIALTLLEAAALLGYYYFRAGAGVAPGDFLLNLLSGLMLVLALRAALVDAWWGWVAACLLLALLCHLADLGRRWRPGAVTDEEE